MLCRTTVQNYFHLKHTQLKLYTFHYVYVVGLWYKWFYFYYCVRFSQELQKQNSESFKGNISRYFLTFSSITGQHILTIFRAFSIFFKIISKNDSQLFISCAFYTYVKYTACFNAWHEIRIMLGFSENGSLHIYSAIHVSLLNCANFKLTGVDDS